MEKTRKYELVYSQFAVLKNGTILYRIRALRDIKDPHGKVIVRKGELGGLIQSENNLSQAGCAWVSYGARVWGGARVCDNAQVGGNATLRGTARADGNTKVSSGIWVY